jgi:hypothetical protein
MEQSSIRVLSLDDVRLLRDGNCDNLSHSIPY